LNEPRPPDDVDFRSVENVVVFLLEELRRITLARAAGEDARRCQVAWLTAFLGFLRVFNASDLTFLPGELVDALVGLEEGRVSSFMRARKRRRDEGPARASTIRVLGIARVVLTVHRLRATGMGTDEARRQATKVCCDVGLKRSRSGKRPGLDIDERTLRGWEEAVAADPGGRTELRRVFDLQARLGPTRDDIKQNVKRGGVESVRKNLLKGLHDALIKLHAAEH